MQSIITSLIGSQYTWATVAGILAIVGVAVYLDRRNRKQKLKEDAEKAMKEYRLALANDPPEKIMIARRNFERLKKYLSAIIAGMILAGCRSAEPVIVPIGEYVQIPMAGEVVPQLPKGESRWLLLSAPTGCKLILGDEF